MNNIHPVFKGSNGCNIEKQNIKLFGDWQKEQTAANGRISRIQGKNNIQLQGFDHQ